MSWSKEFKRFMSDISELGGMVKITRRGNGRWFIVEVEGSDKVTRFYRMVRPGADKKTLARFEAEIRDAVSFIKDNDLI